MSFTQTQPSVRMLFIGKTKYKCYCSLHNTCTVDVSHFHPLIQFENKYLIHFIIHQFNVSDYLDHNNNYLLYMAPHRASQGFHLCRLSRMPRSTVGYIIKHVLCFVFCSVWMQYLYFLEYNRKNFGLVDNWQRTFIEENNKEHMSDAGLHI